MRHLELAKTSSIKARYTECQAMTLLSPRLPNTPPRGSVRACKLRAGRYRTAANKEWVRAVISFLRVFGGV